MKSGKVFILTTEGPVEVQSIVEEAPGVRSVVCVDGRAEALPISNAYNAFVRQPTGLIERMTGHASYRMDVSGRIDEGQSWQLGAYLAHIAAAQGGLGRTVYATGEVAHDGSVRAVDYVDRKLAALTPTEDAVILVPANGEPQAMEAGGTPVIRIASVDEAITAVGLAPQPAQPLKAKPLNSGSKRQHLKGLLLAIAIAAVFFWLGIDPARWGAMHSDGRLLDLETELDAMEGINKIQADLFRFWIGMWRPATHDIRIEGAFSGVPVGETCTDIDKYTSYPTGTFPEVISVCGLHMRAFADGPVVIGRLAYWPEGLGNGGKPARVLRGNGEAGGRSWTFETETPLSAESILRLVVIFGPVDVNGSQPWYNDLLESPTDSAALDAARQRLSRLGFAVHVLDLP